MWGCEKVGADRPPSGSPVATTDRTLGVWCGRCGGLTHVLERVDGGLRPFWVVAR
jgi:hypothetical protein